MVRPGVTTGEIDAAVDKFFVERNAMPLFKGVPGKVPFPAVDLHLGQRRGGPRNSRQTRAREGDIVSIDTGCKFEGWCGDSAVTHPVGKVDPEVQRLLDVTKGVLDLAIELMEEAQPLERSGRAKWATTCATPVFRSSRASSATASAARCTKIRKFPILSAPQLRRNGDFVLEPGLVIAVEPMVNMGTKHVKSLPDYWTQATQDARPSAHFEHTIAMTRQRSLVLTGRSDGRGD